MAQSGSRRRNKDETNYAGFDKNDAQANQLNKQTSTQSLPGSSSTWCPSIHRAFQIIMAARLSAAIWSNISDCDETYNYLEPVHYLLHGHGLQTWEYSPAYAVRSYAYLWLYAMPIKIWQMLFNGDKVLEFIVLRCLMALVSTGCETYFYKSIRHRFGDNVARITLAVLAFSPGMFISSTAFLPSTFAMYTTTLALSSWWSGDSGTFLPVFFVAVGSLVGWPFAAALGIPIAYNLVVNKGKLLKFVACSVVSLVICLVVMVTIDSDYYGKLVVAPLNIVMYNVFSGHGPELYGVEPWPFYFINAFLNFNLAFLLAAMSLLLLILRALFSKAERDNDDCLCILGLHIWMLIFFTRPHKEERFLFPVYPLICLSAAVSMDIIQKFLHHVTSSRKRKSSSPPSDHQHLTRLTNFVSFAFCIIFIVLSLSRTFSLRQGYHAPLKLYSKLNNAILENPSYKNVKSSLNVCVGKEWYRFPSHFFLPDRCHLKFIRSEFRGQLPKEFSRSQNGTREVPDNMNDLNLEEVDRYVSLSSCHYLVDLDTGRSTELEPNYSADKKKWKVVLTEKFLDASRSHSFFRAFYVPFFTPKHVKYIDYNVLVPTKKS